MSFARLGSEGLVARERALRSGMNESETGACVLGTGAVGLVERRVLSSFRKAAARRSTSPQRSLWSRRNET
jgi:hypothetical protein